MTNHLPTTTQRCVFHHRPASQCSPAEIADVLDTLRDLNIDPRIVGPVAELDPCGACSEQSDHPVADAVAVVTHTSRDGRKYPTTVCAAHLHEEVQWHRRNSITVAVEVPSEIAAVAS